jgi:hypothetical protein
LSFPPLWRWPPSTLLLLPPLLLILLLLRCWREHGQHEALAQPVAPPFWQNVRQERLSRRDGLPSSYHLHSAVAAQPVDVNELQHLSIEQLRDVFMR